MHANAKDKDAYTLDELLAHPVDDLHTLDAGRFAETDSYIAADFLMRLTVERRRSVLRLLNESLASDFLSEMDADDSAEVVGAMRESRAVKIIQHLDPDDAADMVGELDENDRERLLSLVAPKVAQKVRYLLKYDPETAGGIMNLDVTFVYNDMSIMQAEERIRQFKKEYEAIFYVYVVDSDNTLLGYVGMRDLVLADPDQRISEIMNVDLKGVCRLEQDREDVANIMAALNFHALPVVDKDDKLVGVVTHDDVIDILHAEATEDMQILVGAGADESIHDSVFKSFKYRSPWLLFNLCTAAVAAVAISFFQDTISEFTLLAVLMPVIAGICGNAGQQALAVAIRSIALNEIHEDENSKISALEAAKGLTNGVLIGLVSSLCVWLLTGEFIIGAIVLASILLSMTLAGLAGALIPILLKKYHFDPAQSASIFLTAITDISSFVIFLTLGKLFLSP